MTTGFDIDGILARLREQARPKSDQEKRDAREAELEDAYVIAAAFDTPAGAKALELLWKKFGAPVHFDAQLGFYEGAAIGFQRSGMGMVLNWIGQKITEARKGAKTRRKGSRR